MAHGFTFAARALLVEDTLEKAMHHSLVMMADGAPGFHFVDPPLQNLHFQVNEVSNVVD